MSHGSFLLPYDMHEIRNFKFLALFHGLDRNESMSSLFQSGSMLYLPGYRYFCRCIVIVFFDMMITAPVCAPLKVCVMSVSCVCRTETGKPFSSANNAAPSVFIVPSTLTPIPCVVPEPSMTEVPPNTIFRHTKRPSTSLGPSLYSMFGFVTGLTPPLIHRLRSRFFP